MFGLGAESEFAAKRKTDIKAKTHENNKEARSQHSQIQDKANQGKTKNRSQ